MSLLNRKSAARPDLTLHWNQTVTQTLPLLITRVSCGDTLNPPVETQAAELLHTIVHLSASSMWPWWMDVGLYSMRHGDGASSSIHRCHWAVKSFVNGGGLGLQLWRGVQGDRVCSLQENNTTCTDHLLIQDLLFFKTSQLLHLEKKATFMSFFINLWICQTLLRFSLVFFCLPADRSQIGCRELRSTKYISDGHCTSINPIKELVCAGECLPAQMLENWIGGAHGRKFWARRSGNHDWRCVNDKTRTQRIQLQCQDGSTRTYKITVVTSCKCKRYSRQHNESGNKFEDPAASSPQLLHKHKPKNKRRLGKKHARSNWHETEP